MEVPQAYVLEIIKTALDEKISSTEENLKNEIKLLRNDVMDFHKTCKIDMKSHEDEMKLHDKRIRVNEDFRLKVVIISGGIGSIAALIFTIIVKVIL